MLLNESIARIQNQEKNSGGFSQAIDYTLLEHSKHHPHNKKVYIDNNEMAKGAKDLKEGRRNRQEFIYHTYKDLMTKTVVDIGCDQAMLRNKVTGKYIGVDNWGNPDIKFNLNSGEPLPLKDKEGNFIVCTDVLEHLYDPHLYCDELFRISAEYVMIGLPNCWMAMHPSFRQGFPSYINYGLAPEKHNDMHRWLFTFEEANDFVLYRAAKNGFECIKTLHFVGRSESSLIWRNRGILSKMLNRLNYQLTRLSLKWLDKKYSREWHNRQVSQAWWLLKRK